MRWCDDRKARVGRTLDTDIHAQPLLIHRNRNEPRVRFLEKSPGQKVAWVFEPASVTRFQHAARDQLQTGTITCANEHLIRRAGDPAGNGEIAGECHAQRLIALRIGIDHSLQAALLNRTAGESRPGLARKGIEGRQAHLQRQRRAARMDSVVCGRRRRGRWNAGFRCRKLWAHNRTRRSPSLQITFADQQLIRRFHRASCQIQFGRQCPHRWHPIARLQLAGADGVAVAHVQLAENGDGIRAIRHFAT